MLRDPFGRTVDYLRLSVPDRCDLRCVYCMPRELDRANKRHILIGRTDRIGDVVLSLPMVSALRAWDRTVPITFLVRTYTRELVEGEPGVTGVLDFAVGGAAKPFGPSWGSFAGPSATRL